MSGDLFLGRSDGSLRFGELGGQDVFIYYDLFLVEGDEHVFHFKHEHLCFFKDIFSWRTVFAETEGVKETISIYEHLMHFYC